MWTFFLISIMVLGLLDQLQIFFTVVSDRIARNVSSSGATRAVALEIRLLTEFDMLVFFTNLSLLEF